MAKQTLNLGSSANDGTGDPLRTPFDKINDNFDELYLYSTAASGNNITITANTIASDDTNGNIIIDPNGTGRLVIATGAEIRLTDHTDNGVAFVDADGDIKLVLVLHLMEQTLQLLVVLVLIQDYFLKTIELQTQTSNDDIDIDPKRNR